MLPPTRRARRLLSVAVAGLAAVALTVTAAGCSLLDSVETGAAEAPGAPTAPPPRYVAMGDSYTAAPLYPLRQQIDGCLRSSTNYPTLIATELAAEFSDVSCSGASTVSMFSRQRFPTADQPPQLDALTPETDLVTLGIGANDYRFFTEMIFECMAVAERDPQGSPCRDRNERGADGDRLDQAVADIGPRVTRVVRAIRERAPEARVLLIGYPQLLPDTGVCRGRLPLAVGDYAYTNRLNTRLAHSVRDGGLAGGAEYVDLLTASRGHDICSDEPWIAGIKGDPRRAMGLHPYPAEQRAVARLVLDLV